MAKKRLLAEANQFDLGKTLMDIKVSNCQECPFVLQDRDEYYSGCSINYDVRTLELGDLPKDKVHNKCPLKLSDYKIKLKL